MQRINGNLLYLLSLFLLSVFFGGKQISNLIRQAYGKHLKVFEQTIPRSVRAAETSAAGKSIFAYDPKGKVAEAYKSLAKEVLADADRQRKLSSERAR